MIIQLCTHSYIQSRAHRCIHVYTNILLVWCTLAHTHAYIYECTHAFTIARMHLHARAHTHMHTCSHKIYQHAGLTVRYDQKSRRPKSCRPFLPNNIKRTPKTTHWKHTAPAPDNWDRNGYKLTLARRLSAWNLKQQTGNYSEPCAGTVTKVSGNG